MEIYKIETETGEWVVDTFVDMDVVHGYIMTGRDVTVYSAEVPEEYLAEYDNEDDFDPNDFDPEEFEWEYYDSYSA